MQHITKSAIRGVKNVAKGYSDTQTKVRDATSNDPWGPSGMQMNEIAQLSYNQCVHERDLKNRMLITRRGDFLDIVEILYKRLNDKGKNWRHVFKSLTVLDYLLRQGSQNVVMYFRDNIYIIKTLREFQYVDEEGKDQGANVRQKAKEITNLLTDEGSLRVARQARADMRDRMLAKSHKNENRGRRDLNKEDDELRRCPVPSPMGEFDAVVVTRYRDARAVLGSDQLRMGGAMPFQPGNLMSYDGEEHTRLRRMLTVRFTVRAMKALEPRVVAIV